MNENDKQANCQHCGYKVSAAGFMCIPCANKLVNSDKQAEPAVNEQLLEAFKDLYSWVYRNVEWGCVPREIIKATAAIRAAEAEKAKGGV